MSVLITKLAVAVVLLIAASPAAATTGAAANVPKPRLEARAVLPVETYAPGPSAGAFFAPSTIAGRPTVCGAGRA